MLPAQQKPIMLAQQLNLILLPQLQIHLMVIHPQFIYNVKCQLVCFSEKHFADLPKLQLNIGTNWGY